jgi:NADH:ubiquinone oxidoreductase subunit D
MSKEKNTNTDIIEKEYTTLNLGPTHPATHGIFQNVLKMDGELLLKANLPLDTFTVLLKKLQNVDLTIKLLFLPIV